MRFIEEEVLVFDMEIIGRGAGGVGGMIDVLVVCSASLTC